MDGWVNVGRWVGSHCLVYGLTFMDGCVNMGGVGSHWWVGGSTLMDGLKWVG